MNRDTNIWQSTSAFVYKLRQVPGHEFIEGIPVPKVENEWSFRVTRTPDEGETGASNALKENLRAAAIVQVLNLISLHKDSNPVLDTSVPLSAEQQQLALSVLNLFDKDCAWTYMAGGAALRAVLYAINLGANNGERKA